MSDILPKLIDNCIKDIEAGRITEKEVVEFLWKNKITEHDVV